MRLSDDDQRVRGLLTRAIAELGHAPSLDALAVEAGCDVPTVAAHLQRLADAHALVLHPNSTRPWVVHPFALAPGSCWVRTPRRGYWANCLYCAFGVAAALDSDAAITTRYGGEDEPARYEIRRGAGVTSPGTDVFHLSTPAARWWDNVIFSCSSFQPFHSQADIDRWCRVHDLPRGATLSIPQLWEFAKDWYGGYLSAPAEALESGGCGSLREARIDRRILEARDVRLATMRLTVPAPLTDDRMPFTDSPERRCRLRSIQAHLESEE